MYSEQLSDSTIEKLIHAPDAADFFWSFKVANFRNFTLTPVSPRRRVRCSTIQVEIKFNRAYNSGGLVAGRRDERTGRALPPLQHNGNEE